MTSALTWRSSTLHHQSRRAVLPAEVPNSCLIDTFAMTKIDSRAHKAAMVLYEQDCAVLATPDYTTPFRDFPDAFSRLLPYHVRMHGDDDADASPESAGA